MTRESLQKFSRRVQGVHAAAWGVTVSYAGKQFPGAAGSPSASAALLGDGGGYGASRALMLHVLDDVATGAGVAFAENERVQIRRADSEAFVTWRIDNIKHDTFARQWVLTLQDENT